MRHWQTAIKYPHSTDRMRWQQRYSGAHHSTRDLLESFTVSLCCLLSHPFTVSSAPHILTVPSSKTPFFFFLEPSGLCQLLFWRCSYTTWPASVGGMETWLTPNCHKTNSDAISNSLHSSISDPSSGNLCEKSAQTQIVLQVSRDGCCFEPVGKWTKDQRFEFQLQLSTCLSVLEH